MPGLDRLGQRRLVDALNDGFGALYAWPKPLVAAVNGHAIAGGLIMALCADWRIVADAPMQISLAEVRVGVTYPVAALEIARAELSPSAARRLILLGETVDAAAAQSLAIMDERVPFEVLLARAIAQAERHASLPPQAFATIMRELRAAELERIAAVRVGQGEPRLAAWLGEEMRRASTAVLRTSSAVLRGAARAASQDASAGLSCRQGGRSVTMIVRVLTVMALVLAASIAQAQNKVPSERALEALVKTTLLTFNDANVTGNYEVFHAKLSKPFRDQFPVERLVRTFRDFNKKHLDFDIIAAMKPAYDPPPRVDDEGKLLVKGSFPTEPLRVYFNLDFIPSDGEWKLIRINVKVDSPP